jgi:solute carrier family 25 (peroxisomal adenine nucleotide transporter), member 17
MPSRALLEALAHASSGAAGTAIATAVVYPLDLVTTRLKVQGQVGKVDSPEAQEERPQGVIDNLHAIVLREGGLLALYAGLAQDLTKSVADSFLFFLFYTYLRNGRKGRRGSRPLPDVEELIIGALAGACARAFTTPIANVVTRKQTYHMLGSEASGQEPTTREIMADILKEKGVSGLWAGYSATLVLTLNPSITFFLQERLARSQISTPSTNAKASKTFLFAAGSKAIATAATYPFQTAKALLQVQGRQDSESAELEEKRQPDEDASSRTRMGRFRRLADSGLFGAINGTARSNGIAALYRGIGAEMVKGFCSHGLTMLAKGTIHSLIIRFVLVVSARLRRIQTAPYVE